MTKTPYVDYYNENEISPVSQDISDLHKHFERRSSLYKDLGLPPFVFAQSKILDIGPGSGYNSIQVAQYCPRRYTLVEPNHAGRENLKKLFAEFAPNCKYDLSEDLIQQFKTDEKFDIVLAEGFLGLMHNATEVIRDIGKFVIDGGVILMTTCDSISFYPDLLRRIIGLLIDTPDAPIKDRLTLLTPVFSKLVKIEGMSRPIEDWILDNITQPFEKNYAFSIVDCIDALEDNFVFYNSSSPRMFTDMRWHKMQCNQGNAFNDMAKQQYYSLVHNHLDCRFTIGERPESENKELLNRCESIFQHSLHFEKSHELIHMEQLLAKNQQLCDFLLDMKLHAETVKSIRDANHGLEELLNGNTDPDFKTFPSYSGRGQQYASFIKKSDPFVR